MKDISWYQLIQPEKSVEAFRSVFSMDTQKLFIFDNGSLLRNVDSIQKFADVLVLNLDTLLDESSCKREKKNKS